MLKTVSTNYSKFGGIYIDPMFETNYAACKANNIPVGAYYYTYATTIDEVIAELTKLREALRDKQFDLPIAVDVEENKLKTLSRDALTDLVCLAASTIESWGFYTMIYTYLSYQKTELDMDRLSRYDLWLAAYRDTRPDSPKHGMWQYTKKGIISGIKANVDISHAYKNYPAIIQKAGLTKIK